MSASVGKDIWVMTAQQLRQWKKELDREISVADDGIDVVKRELAYILDQMDSTEEEGTIINSYDDLELDCIYLFESTGNRARFSGELVKVVLKPGRYLTVQLVDGASGYPKGYRFDIDFMDPDSGVFKTVSR